MVTDMKKIHVTELLWIFPEVPSNTSTVPTIEHLDVTKTEAYQSFVGPNVDVSTFACHVIDVDTESVRRIG